MAAMRKITVRLDEATVRRVQVLAAKRGTSMSALVASQIEKAFQAGDETLENTFEVARRSALEMLDRGFHLGGVRLDRYALQRT